MKTFITILGIVLLVILQIIPLKSQDTTFGPGYRIIVNPFNQPNDSTLNYYGSGDVNNDNKIDNNDINSIEYLIGQSVPPTLMQIGLSVPTNRQLDRADVNGDKLITIDDKIAIQNYLSSKDKSLLPGRFWNYLNKEQKLNWVKKMNNVELYFRFNNLFPESWICSTMAIQTIINFSGFKGISNYKDFSFENNGRFNLPIFYIHLDISNHAVNSILIGTNPRDLNDWYCFDATGGYIERYPGQDKMPVYSKLEFKKFSITLEDGVVEHTLLVFQLDSLLPRLVGSNPEKILFKNPINDKNVPNISFDSLENNILYSKLPTMIKYKIIDGNFIETTRITNHYPEYDFDIYDGSFLDTCWYKLNNEEKNILKYWIRPKIRYQATYSSYDSINLANRINEGKNSIITYLSDIAGNKKIDTLNFYIDTQKPNLSSDKTDIYTNNNSLEIPWKVEDENLNSTCLYVNGILEDSSLLYYGKFNFIFSSEGVYNLVLKTEDKAENINSISRKAFFDKTKPILKITGFEDSLTLKDSIPIKISIIDNYLDSCSYSINNSEWKDFYSYCTFYMQLRKGENSLEVKSKDKAGNSSYEKKTIRKLETGLNNPNIFDIKTIDIYPNPIIDFINIKIETKEFDFIKIEIIDNNGKAIIDEVKKCNLICYYKFNMRNFSIGTYIILIEFSDGKRFVKKIVKK
jgi:hypothetical protein